MFRTFIAIEMPAEVRESLNGIRTSLDRAGQDVVRWVGPDAIHLTLKFLGEIPASIVPQVNTAIEEASKGISPFALQIGELGFFPNANRPRVFWVGLKGDLPELFRLQENVELALEALNFPREARGFSPHLTVARFKEYADREGSRLFVESARRVRMESTPNIHVGGLSLMQSILGPTGAKYSRLSFFALGS